MRGLTSVNRSQEGSAVQKLTALGILCVIGDICFVVGLYLLLSPNKRLKKITQYNEEVDLWNDVLLNTFNETNFSLQVGSQSYTPEINSTQFGLFYPYRDSCTEKKDPNCIASEAFYYSFSLPVKGDNNYNFVLSESDSVFYNKTIALTREWSLSKRTIGCEGGSQTTCKTRCINMGGTWGSDYLCHLIGYLNHICLRVIDYQDTNQTMWKIDMPPKYPLEGKKVEEGCDYIQLGNFETYTNHDNWIPALYTLNKTDYIVVDIRHAGDMYVRTSSITHGCSSNTLTDGHCFGSPKFDNMIIITIILCIGTITVIFEIMFLALYSSGIITVSWLDEVIHPKQTNLIPPDNILDMPLEEKTPLNNVRNDDHIYRGKRGSNTEEDLDSALTAIQTDDPFIHLTLSQYASTYEPEELSGQLNGSPYDTPYGETNYEGCEDGI